MNSVQENKNELEAAVRYCESAISRAQATIESMEFRQQAASKAWHEQTGREESLTKKLAFMTEEYDRMKGYADKLLDENGDLEERNDSLVATIQRHKDEIAELNKAYKDECHETNVWKKAHQEQRGLVALRNDQIAMLERRLAKSTGEKAYPFKEGDLYYVFNGFDGTWIESVWDDESERIHDSTDLPDRPHKVYFTVDQKNVLDKFKPEDD
jgi:chromosome segregation ATPase